MGKSPWLLFMMLTACHDDDIMPAILTLRGIAMTKQIIIGNIISFFAAVLLALTAWTKSEKRTFIYQVGENLVLGISSLVFGSFAAAVTAFLSASRCIVILKGKYTKPVMFLYTVLIVVLGLLTNTKGIIGFLPVIASVEYAMLNYYTSDIRGLKWALIINLALWDFYAFWIKDFSSGIAWIIMIVVTLVSLWKLRVKEGHSAEQNRE